MRNSMQDIRYAIRLLLRAPGFTIIAALTLALGIGANTAIFSVVHGVLVKPLPYPDPDALIRIFEESPPDTPEFPLSPGTFIEYRNHSRAFARIAAYERSDLQLGGERPEQLRGMRVTAGFFQLLGLSAASWPRVHASARKRRATATSPSFRMRSGSGDFSRTRPLSERRSCCRDAPFEIVGVLPRGVQHVGGTLSLLSARGVGRRLVAADAADLLPAGATARSTTSASSAGCRRA